MEVRPPAKKGGVGFGEVGEGQAEDKVGLCWGRYDQHFISQHN